MLAAKKAEAKDIIVGDAIAAVHHDLDLEAKASGWSQRMLASKKAESEQAISTETQADVTGAEDQVGSVQDAGRSEESFWDTADLPPTAAPATASTKEPQPTTSRNVTRSSDKEEKARGQDCDDEITYVERVWDNEAEHQISKGVTNEGESLYSESKHEKLAKKRQKEREERERRHRQGIESSSSEESEEEEEETEGIDHLRKFRMSEVNKGRNDKAQKDYDIEAEKKRKDLDRSLLQEKEERAALTLSEDDLDDPTVRFAMARKAKNDAIAAERQRCVDEERQRLHQIELEKAAAEAERLRKEKDAENAKAVLARKAAERKKRKVRKGCIDAGAHPKAWIGFLDTFHAATGRPPAEDP